MASPLSSASRREGDRLIAAQAQQQVQTFFDELKNGTRNYKTIRSLDGQIAQEYRGRCILELLQNAHDALANRANESPQRIAFLLQTDPEPVLLVANGGRPFGLQDFRGLCQLGQSPKNPNESVGNKGLGFRSVLEVSSVPEIWSISPNGASASFVFRFDPSVLDSVADTARKLSNGSSPGISSPFDPDSPLLDWTDQQLTQFRERVGAADFDATAEATTLSPYILPLPIRGESEDVADLFRSGYVTVVRLPLDGGRTGNTEEAVQSVRAQLAKLTSLSMVFLHNLEELVIEADGERRAFRRSAQPEVQSSSARRTQRQQVLVQHLHHDRGGSKTATPTRPAPPREEFSSNTMSDDDETEQFLVWTRQLGGPDLPEEADRIRAAVKHLPNRWPEVDRVTVSIAVERASKPSQGRFVIFLPTDVETGTGTHINAPFYGSLDRRHIDFNDSYNELLLEVVLDLTLEAATQLTEAAPEESHGRAVLDLLASTKDVGGWDFSLMDELNERAADGGDALASRPLILCDDGWRVPTGARAMPRVPSGVAIKVDQWRSHADFGVISAALDSRKAASEALLERTGGSTQPTAAEWVHTIERLAAAVRLGELDVSWNAFLKSLIAVLPERLRLERPAGAADPLANARFLPDQANYLLSASDPAKLFFQPVQGIDDAAELGSDVPNSLKDRVAFLHSSVQTHMQDGSQRRNTPVQKFLAGRFVREFRREELLRVLVDALPPLPAAYGSKDAELCSELFEWALKVVGEEPSETLLPHLGRLPVACHGGWRAMEDSAFGPGWPDRLGEDLWKLVAELPADLGKPLQDTALLPPTDSRWRIGSVADLGCLFRLAGVFDGLRLQQSPDMHFEMSQWHYELPTEAPSGVPQPAWDAWRRTAREEAKPHYVNNHGYTMSRLQLLPPLHHLELLGSTARAALSRVVLRSIEAWPRGWETVTIRKPQGLTWSRPVTSPLKHWLVTLEWFGDRRIFKPLAERWLVPVAVIGNQLERFRHLDPVTVKLARELEDNPELTDVLRDLGLKTYPEEKQFIGPELLNALADAWKKRRVPPERFDVFLGQVRDGWRHFDPTRSLPDTFLARKGRRDFEVLKSDELVNVYLRDDNERARALLDHGELILEMDPSDGTKHAPALSASTDIKRASVLEELVLLDGERWVDAAEGTQPLHATQFTWWLPVTLLVIAANGGARPTGKETKRWTDAAERLHGLQVLECETLAIQLVDGDDALVRIEPDAKWLPGNVLAIRRDVGTNWESLAPAAQEILDRQDLVKDLRLVLGALSGNEMPTRPQLVDALERDDIDDAALADVEQAWAEKISLVVDRLRPVLAVLNLETASLDHVAASDGLTEWLSAHVPQWPAPELLAAAHRSRDDAAMGDEAWSALGETAQLPAWNAALRSLGDRYDVVENAAVAQQTSDYLEEAAPLLRGLARNVAKEAGDATLFLKLEAITRGFEAPSDWARRWWEVPFGSIVDVLLKQYAETLGSDELLGALADAATLEELRDELQRLGIHAEPDPYDLAYQNRERLIRTVGALHDLYRLWADSERDALQRPSPEIPAELEPNAYLCEWSSTDLLRKALELLGDAAFTAACGGCEHVDQVSAHLGLAPEAVAARRHKRHQETLKAERQRRTFEVAGEDFEVGVSSYGDLFDRLRNSHRPDVSPPGRDPFTHLLTSTPYRSSRRGGSAQPPPPGKISQRRPSAEKRELIGIAGEIHAYHHLRDRFGSNAVTLQAWVSEIRLKVRHPVAEEPDETSDRHGYDFRFRYQRTWWHVEVKATVGDDPQFELGVSEINAATRFANRRGGKWVILRVNHALDEQPMFELLPNPFEERYKQKYRLHKGGMRVSYRPKREP